jgi:hypothetical protein
VLPLCQWRELRPLAKMLFVGHQDLGTRQLSGPGLSDIPDDGRFRRVLHRAFADVADDADHRCVWIFFLHGDGQRRGERIDVRQVRLREPRSPAAPLQGSMSPCNRSRRSRKPEITSRSGQSRRGRERRPKLRSQAGPGRGATCATCARGCQPERIAAKTIAIASAGRCSTSVARQIPTASTSTKLVARAVASPLVRLHASASRVDRSRRPTRRRRQQTRTRGGARLASQQRLCGARSTRWIATATNSRHYRADCHDAARDLDSKFIRPHRCATRPKVAGTSKGNRVPR